MNYIVQLVHATRKSPLIRYGVSPRAGIALASCCQGLAYIYGEDFVSPDLVQECTPLVFCHRVVSEDPVGAVAQILQMVPVGF